MEADCAFFYPASPQSGPDIGGCTHVLYMYYTCTIHVLYIYYAYTIHILYIYYTILYIYYTYTILHYIYIYIYICIRNWQCGPDIGGCVSETGPDIGRYVSDIGGYVWICIWQWQDSDPSAPYYILLLLLA